MQKQYSELSLMDFTDIPGKNLFERAALFYDYSKEVKAKKHYNYCRVSLSGSGPVMEVEDPYSGRIRKMIYLASNDYLNLTKHPKTIAAGKAALEKYGTGAGSVPLLGGTLALHRELEQKIACFKGCSHALLYTSGFGSNCSTLLALLGKADLAILDILDHASLFDGCRNTNVKLFKHNDPASLEKILKRESAAYRTRMIVVDGVYSMDGDIVKLDQIVEMAKHYNAFVMVDEAHATGVIGESGKGTPEHFHIEGKVDLVAGTFSKTLGTVGGFIASNHPGIIEYLRFYSRAYMFSTAMTPQAAGSLLAAISVIEEEPELRGKLWNNIAYFREQLLALGFNIGNSETAIFPLILADDYKVKEACRMLHERDIYVSPVLYPAVKKSEARIRISLTALHTRAHLDATLAALAEVRKKLSL